MNDVEVGRPRRGRTLRPPQTASVGTSEYAAAQRRYDALAGQVRILAYTTSPALLLEREAWLRPQVWAWARERTGDPGALGGPPRPVVGRSQREGTRLQYLRLAKVLEDLARFPDAAKVLEDLARFPDAANFSQAERDAWGHIWAAAEDRGWVAGAGEDQPGDSTGKA